MSSLRAGALGPGCRLGANTPVLRSGKQISRRVLIQDRRPVKVQAGSQSLDDTKDGCPVFIDKYGNVFQAMCADYGFRAGAGRLYQEHYGEVPKDVWQLAKDNFQHELLQLRRSVRYNELAQEVESRPPKNWVARGLYAATGALFSGFAVLDKALEGAGVLAELKPPPTRSALETEEFKAIRAKLDKLQLTTESVMRVEEERVQAAGGDMYSPLWVKAPFYALCWVLDVVYDNRPLQKFWVLETVARIPYFAYISILHLYESLGFWRAGAELRKIHFAEEWNEMHHLQIMESLGGDRHWFDRFLAEHSAVLYYWMLILFYLINPKMAYNFMQRVELHAADTYTAFLNDNHSLLESIPAPYVALNYYLNSDLYLFDQFQTGNATEPRRPTCGSLLDVFVNIRDDEREHVKTMLACQEETIAADIAALQAARIAQATTARAAEFRQSLRQQVASPTPPAQALAAQAQADDLLASGDAPADGVQGAAEPQPVGK